MAQANGGPSLATVVRVVGLNLLLLGAYAAASRALRKSRAMFDRDTACEIGSRESISL